MLFFYYYIYLRFGQLVKFFMVLLLALIIAVTFFPLCLCRKRLSSIMYNIKNYEAYCLHLKVITQKSVISHSHYGMNLNFNTQCLLPVNNFFHVCLFSACKILRAHDMIIAHTLMQKRNCYVKRIFFSFTHYQNFL